MPNTLYQCFGTIICVFLPVSELPEMRTVLCYVFVHFHTSTKHRVSQRVKKKTVFVQEPVNIGLNMLFKFFFFQIINHTSLFQQSCG